MIAKDDKDGQIEYLKSRLENLRSRFQDLKTYSWSRYCNDYDYSYDGMIDFIDKSFIEVTY